MSVIDDAMGQGLRLLNFFAGQPVVKKYGLLDPAEKFLYGQAKLSLKAAAAAQQAAKKLRPKRPRPEQPLEKEERLGKVENPDYFDLTPNDSQQLVIDTMRSFAEDRLRPAALDADAQCEVPEGFLDEAHELGMTMLAVPEALGGAADERAVLTYALTAEALAHGDMGLAVAALAPASVAHALVEWGTKEQQGKYLPALVGDESYPVACAFTEPHPLFDATKLRTMAKKDGDDYLLSGVKTMVPLAQRAEWFLVCANLHGRTQAFIVEGDAEGLTIEADPTMGLRAAEFGKLTLKNVRVSADAMLGGKDGFDAQRMVDLGRIAWSALAVGTCQAVLDYVKEYCNDRKAFGEPITNRQAVAFMIADIAVELEGMRLLTWRAASRAEQGLSFTREAALARVQCAEKGMLIGTNGVQLLGGHGYTKEHPVERWYRHLRAVAVLEGGLLV